MCLMAAFCFWRREPPLEVPQAEEPNAPESPTYEYPEGWENWEEHRHEP